MAGHKEINERLNNSLYEVLDALCMYVFGKKPNHKNGEHMIPINTDNDGLEIENYQEGIKKMQQVKS